MGFLGEHTDSHLKEIIDKLDDLFLYLSTVPTILFTVIQAALGEEMLLVFLPILIPTFVALYIGYIRGAITVNTIEERIRGWIYLIAAILFYPVNYCEAYLWPSSLDILLIKPLLSGLLGGILGYITASKFTPFFANLARRKRPKIKEILNITFLASMFLIATSQYLSIFIFKCLRNSPGRYYTLFLSMFFGILFIIYEFLVRRELRRIASKP